jgi:hypothetical protein
VLDQPPGHPWHIRWFPYEDVLVSPEEADERVFLFPVKTIPDHGSLAVVNCPDVHDLHLHFLRWLRLVSYVGLFWDLKFSWGELVRNRMPVSLRGGGGELGNLKP